MERLISNKNIWKQIPGRDGVYYTAMQNALMALATDAMKDIDLHSIEGNRFSYMINIAVKELEKLIREYPSQIKREGWNIVLSINNLDLTKSINIDRYKMPIKPKIKGVKYELSYVGEWELNHKLKKLLWRLSSMPFIVNKEDCANNPREKENNEIYTLESSIFKRLASKENEVIRIPHFFDKRGRFYSDSYGLNYQGDEWSKASISPKYFRKVEAKNLKWLAIDIANHFGLDKETNEVKLAWFKSVRRHRFMSLIAASRGRGYLIKLADKPLLFKRAVKAWVDAEIFNKPINHFVSLDATASGMQILGLMARDKKLCMLTNLTHSDNCYDVYELVGREVAKYKGLPYSKAIRKPCKKVTMTYYYNSQKGLEEQAEALNKIGGKKITPSKLEELVIKVSSGAKKVKDLINKVFDKLPDTNSVIRFTMPDGFQVELPLISKAMMKVRCNYKDVNFMYDINKYNKNDWRGLVPNIIHAIDSWIAREMVYRAKFPIYCIHDCFYCHPNNVDEMKRNMYEILREVANKDFYNYICSQICRNAGIEFERVDFGKENIIINPNAYFIC